MCRAKVPSSVRRAPAGPRRRGGSFGSLASTPLSELGPGAPAAAAAAAAASAELLGCLPRVWHACSLLAKPPWSSHACLTVFTHIGLPSLSSSLSGPEYRVSLFLARLAGCRCPRKAYLGRPSRTPTREAGAASRPALAEEGCSPRAAAHCRASASVRRASALARRRTRGWPRWTRPCCGEQGQCQPRPRRSSPTAPGWPAPAGPGAAKGAQRPLSSSPAPTFLLRGK